MLFSMFGNKDKELPFPWTCRKPHPVDQGSLEQSGGSIPSRNSCQTFDDFRSVPDLSTLQQQCEALGCISFQLPRPLANAGAILQHAVGAMDTLIRLQSPLIFKVGFSTDVVRRWTNSTYGYGTDPARWTDMIVLFASKEPFTPAMLEAALVHKYKSCLVAYGKFDPLGVLIFLPMSIVHVVQSQVTISWGMQGCRNVRPRGDTVDTTCSTSSGAQFMTYVVYRSFKTPPPIPPLKP